MNISNVKTNDELIDVFFDKLNQYNILTDDKIEKIEFSIAEKYVIDQVNKFVLWGGKLGISNIFTFENQTIKANSLVKSITNLKSMISTSKFQTESYIEKVVCKGKVKEEERAELSIKSPNHTNNIEREILDLLNIQQIFLDKIQEFIRCINELDSFYKIIIYYRYLKSTNEPITGIQSKYIDCCSLATVYRMRDKAIVELYEKLNLSDVFMS